MLPLVSLLIVVLRKQDGILHICEDYKLDMEHKICSDSYLIPSIDSALHVLTEMKFFAKIDFKIAYQQIQTDDNFKEIPIINTSMGFTRWIQMSFGVKTVFQQTIEIS